MSKKILIVEDEVSLAGALNKKFTMESFQVFLAKNGQEGLVMALAEHPDVVLLDIIMPVMDGITMLKKLREDTWGKTVPVIILTNLSDSEKVMEAHEKGVFDYLIKFDWRINDVVDKVKEKIGVSN